MFEGLAVGLRGLLGVQIEYLSSFILRFYYERISSRNKHLGEAILAEFWIRKNSSSLVVRSNFLNLQISIDY